MVADTASFVVADRPQCGGTLKPDIVYFGESVAKDVVAQAFSMVDDADALLVAGSSLTVMSGLRFVRHAAAHGKPVAIVNRGTTRGDRLAELKIDHRCEVVLPPLPCYFATPQDTGIAPVISGCKAALCTLLHSNQAHRYRATMALEHAIMVSLGERPGTGYEIAQQFDRSIGHFWSATHQQVYRTLKKLHADGFVAF